MKPFWLLAAMATLLTAPLAAQAEDHTGHTMPGMNHGADPHASHGQTGMFMRTVEVDGIAVTFHVMPTTPDMDHGGTHNLMVKFAQGGGEVMPTGANSKVIHPGDVEESHMLMKMGGWWMAGYDLSAQGAHQIMVLFMTDDGAKHFTGIWSPNEP